jgi:SAM-dependent methyltransferase
MAKLLERIKRRLYLLFRDPREKRHAHVGPSYLWKMKQDFQFNFLIHHGLKTSDTFLDIGCGTLRGGLPIIQHLEKGNYYGIEVRKNVLAEGRKELKSRKLEYKNPNLFLFSDFGELDFDNTFDKIFAFSVLIHMEDEIVEKCFSFVHTYLSETGIFYANVNIEKQKDGNWQGFPVVFRSVDFYEKLALRNNLSMQIVGRLKDLGHISGQELADRQVMLEFRKS